ncbi:MAG: hypothetical protein AB7V50_11280 [Vampirovibrionia bacterium]
MLQDIKIEFTDEELSNAYNFLRKMSEEDISFIKQWMELYQSDIEKDIVLEQEEPTITKAFKNLEISLKRLNNCI